MCTAEFFNNSSILGRVLQLNAFLCTAKCTENVEWLVNGVNISCKQI